MRRDWTLLILAVTLATLAGGCSQTVDSQAKQPLKVEPAAAAAKTGDGHSHDGWWCNEHGVPEEICGLCDSKVAAELQKKGDWCKLHDRPDSQCFVCHPEHEERFAAQYEAKFGSKPPKPES